jgi:hypothetical protein
MTEISLDLIAIELSASITTIDDRDRAPIMTTMEESDEGGCNDHSGHYGSHTPATMRDQ